MLQNKLPATCPPRLSKQLQCSRTTPDCKLCNACTDLGTQAPSPLSNAGPDRRSATAGCCRRQARVQDLQSHHAVRQIGELRRKVQQETLRAERAEREACDLKAQLGPALQEAARMKQLVSAA